jgi:hypothetical protein
MEQDGNGGLKREQNTPVRPRESGDLDFAASTIRTGFPLSRERTAFAAVLPYFVVSRSASCASALSASLTATG